jgi:hypothetical protein
VWSIQAIVFWILILAALVIVARVWLGSGREEEERKDVPVGGVGGAEGEGKAPGLGSRDDGGIGGAEGGG